MKKNSLKLLTKDVTVNVKMFSTLMKGRFMAIRRAEFLSQYKSAGLVNEICKSLSK